jgi:hypothetical protein
MEPTRGGRVPILPLVDLLILTGSASLLVGFLLKAIAMATIYRPSLLGFTSLDFALISAVCFAMALVLVARTWLKLNEPELMALRSRLRREEAQRRAYEIGQANHSNAPPGRDVAGVDGRETQARND